MPLLLCVIIQVMMMQTKTYLELITLPTFKERLEYLMLYGKVGEDTFGHSRYLNQALYNSREWKELRHEIVIRDKGCDLAMEGYEIMTRPTIHHINPITKEDILNRAPCVFDRNNLVLVSKKTHDLIHYAFDTEGVDEPVIVRSPNDTLLW